MAEFAWPLTDLGVTREAVKRECGGAGGDLAETLDSTIDSLLAEAAVHAAPRAGFVLTTETFDTGPVVAEQLSGAERLAVFLATLGEGFDRWARGFFEAGDPFSGFVADTVGSLAAEATVDLLADAVAAAVGDLGLTNRYSPGYCGWDVAEQHRLFGVLPAGFLGVRLTESALMVPLKSVSGVIGIGPGLTKHDYPCATCPRDDCPTGRRAR